MVVLLAEAKELYLKAPRKEKKQGLTCGRFAQYIVMAQKK
jgi:hypothetical protein